MAVLIKLWLSLCFCVALAPAFFLVLQPGSAPSCSQALPLAP